MLCLSAHVEFAKAGVGSEWTAHFLHGQKAEFQGRFDFTPHNQNDSQK